MSPQDSQWHTGYRLPTRDANTLIEVSVSVVIFVFFSIFVIVLSLVSRWCVAYSFLQGVVGLTVVLRLTLHRHYFNTARYWWGWLNMLLDSSTAMYRYMKMKNGVPYTQIMIVQFLHCFCRRWDRWQRCSVQWSSEKCCRLKCWECPTAGFLWATYDKWTDPRRCRVTYECRPPQQQPSTAWRKPPTCLWRSGSRSECSSSKQNRSVSVLTSDVSVSYNFIQKKISHSYWNV